jgi:hypothetical protein
MPLWTKKSDLYYSVTIEFSSSDTIIKGFLINFMSFSIKSMSRESLSDENPAAKYVMKE